MAVGAVVARNICDHRRRPLCASEVEVGMTRRSNQRLERPPNGSSWLGCTCGRPLNRRPLDAVESGIIGFIGTALA